MRPLEPGLELAWSLGSALHTKTAPIDDKAGACCNFFMLQERSQRSSRIVLRPVSEGDLPGLLEILREPEVARHWSPPDDEFDRKLLSGDDVDGAECITTFVIALNAETIGWIAGWEKLEPDYRHAGIDLFLSTRHQGQGFGTEAIRLVCRFLFEERGHHRITIDPAADNVRAVRAYERVGFKRVGVMRRYERGADGTFHDGMLLDLLPEDLIDGSCSGDRNSIVSILA
jgi:aminoglycoside 6'-N-acetyltransferase